jgi:hypothetical protein
MNPLKTFDFSCLDDATFREDAVCEEVVAPIIRALGYRHRGHYRVERSKTLKHPFNMLGRRKHSVRTIPDYTLIVGKKAVLVLDAKGPGEEVTKPEHMFQAHSYASHPEIRCYRYALCNGRSLLVVGPESWEPEANIPLDGSGRCWRAIEKAIGPKALTPSEAERRGEDDLHTAWFHLLGTVVSPNTPGSVAAQAAYRLSWYMPTVNTSREAAAKAAMANLADDELMTLLRAAQHALKISDDVISEHIGDLLSYDKQMVPRLKALLATKKIPASLEFITSQLARFISQEE